MWYDELVALRLSGAFVEYGSHFDLKSAIALGKTVGYNDSWLLVLGIGNDG